MVHLLNSSQTVYLRSENRIGGTTSQYEVAIEKDLLECGENEVMQLSLDYVSFFNSFNNVSAALGTNQVLVTPSGGSTQTVTIPDGCYTMRDLASTLTQLVYNDPTRFYVKYSRPLNGFTFSCSPSHTVSFPGSAGVRWGFTGPAGGTSFASTTAADPFPVRNAYIRLSSTVPLNGRFCIDNLNAAETTAQRSDLLACVPVASFDPYTICEYPNINKAFMQFVADKQITRLSFVITDENMVPIPNFPEHQMTLRVDVYTDTDLDSKDMVASLKDIRDLQQMQFLTMAGK